MELDDTRTKMYNNYKYCIKNITHTPENIQHFIEQAYSNFKGMLELNQEVLELKEENQRLTQRIKELEEHIENSQYDHVRNYEKYEDDIIHECKDDMI